MSALRDLDQRLLSTTWRPGFELDLAQTLSPLRHGFGDPTIRISTGSAWRATRTPHGPATAYLELAGDVVRAFAWGPGAAWAIEHVPSLLGSDDRPEALQPQHALVRDLQRRRTGIRFGRSDAVLESMIPAIAEQKVTGIEARAAYRRLIYRFGERAPGPARLWLAPSPEVLAGLPYFALHPLGFEQRRAIVMRRAAQNAARLEAAASLPPTEALARMQTIPGVGPWTAAETARSAFGDPDAVSVGDFHLKNVVCWALAREPRGTDERMLELLEPYRGQRARVARLIESSGIQPPKYGPRMPVGSIADF